MKPPEGVKRPTTSDSRYRNLSLMKLVKKIVDKSDRRALQEFHNSRTLFHYNGGPPLHFIDYLNELRESAAKRVWSAPHALQVAEKAYDLTIDKFNNLPGKKRSSRKGGRKPACNMKPQGIDCRLNFMAFLKKIDDSFTTEPPQNQIEEEARAAMILQGLVSRHFYRSLLDALRKANPFRSRYNWRVRGKTICVWLPVSLEGRKRREWLAKKIDDPDPRRPGETERIQSIIDRELVRGRFVPIDPDTHHSSGASLLPWSHSGGTFGESLAQAIADEKARNIHMQRPCIRALGDKALRQLVLRIFKDLRCDEYEDGKVARDFGLSKATFSRFAGSKWLLSESGIPDLWKNAAEVISTNPTFKEVAIDTGSWKQVESALQRSTLQAGEGAIDV